MRTICVINGHPDPGPEHLCAQLAEAYAQAAEAAGHQLIRLAVGSMAMEFLRNATDFASLAPPPIAQAQDAIRAADHVVLVYPLWFGTMPARLKAFVEQLGRNEFLIGVPESGYQWPAQKMRYKSARVVVTMGMPSLAYRLYFGCHSLRAVECGILGIVGFRPVRGTLFGMVEASPQARAKMLTKMQTLGRKGV